MSLMQIESELRLRLARLTARAGAIDRDLRTNHDDDAAEQATERENEEVLQRLDAATRNEVKEIQRALDRMERGRYGVCETCQKQIGAVRLIALPTARLCSACSARNSVSGTSIAQSGQHPRLP